MPAMQAGKPVKASKKPAAAMSLKSTQAVKATQKVTSGKSVKASKKPAGASPVMAGSAASMNAMEATTADKPGPADWLSHKMMTGPRDEVEVMTLIGGEWRRSAMIPKRWSLGETLAKLSLPTCNSGRPLEVTQVVINTVEL
ncbi:unnamed protein product [Symbiodinium sp. CCMP2592]|nr:unnamed protein product [Symbiodinium sp. CCMP2592]CAE7503986.1 unnamed protein product [Symbiodinium sp. CCMP2592]